MYINFIFWFFHFLTLFNIFFIIEQFDKQIFNVLNWFKKIFIKSNDEQLKKKFNISMLIKNLQILCKFMIYYYNFIINNKLFICI